MVPSLNLSVRFYLTFLTVCIYLLILYLKRFIDVFLPVYVYVCLKLSVLAYGVCLRVCVCWPPRVCECCLCLCQSLFVLPNASSLFGLRGFSVYDDLDLRRPVDTTLEIMYRIYGLSSMCSFKT